MVIKVGINGFGRIGRVIFRTCLEKSDVEIVAINDPAIDLNYICYLVKFDSTHGKFKGEVIQSEGQLIINDKPIKVFHQKSPSTIPWSEAGVQYVVEASGMFTSLEKAAGFVLSKKRNPYSTYVVEAYGMFTSLKKAAGHLACGGVRRVLVTAPSNDAPMIILGVNTDKVGTVWKVVSCASSTVYCLVPIVRVLEDHYGVVEGSLTSIHAMTPSLKPLDGLCVRGKHWRDHRSIHQNIIPATTGACKALGKIIPSMKDKLRGMAFRVPIVNVSVLDLTIRLKKDTTMADIVKNIEKAGQKKMMNIIKTSNDEAVSSDFIGDSFSCILDIDSSMQLSPNLFKLVCWYENEYSYACRVIETMVFSENQLLEEELKLNFSFMTNTISETGDGNRSLTKQFLSKHQNIGLCNKLRCSQNIELRTKFSTPPTLMKNSTPKTSSSLNWKRDSNRANEIFKMWNDGKIIRKATTRPNKNSFAQSCMSFTPDSKELKLQSQERLQKVKTEFTKMLHMTESLLRKSQTTSKPKLIRNVSEFHPRITSKDLNDIKHNLKSNDPDVKLQLKDLNDIKHDFKAYDPDIKLELGKRVSNLQSNILLLKKSDDCETVNNSTVTINSKMVRSYSKNSCCSAFNPIGSNFSFTATKAFEDSKQIPLREVTESKKIDMNEDGEQKFLTFDKMENRNEIDADIEDSRLKMIVDKIIKASINVDTEKKLLNKLSNKNKNVPKKHVRLVIEPIINHADGTKETAIEPDINHTTDEILKKDDKTDKKNDDTYEYSSNETIESSNKNDEDPNEFSNKDHISSNKTDEYSNNDDKDPNEYSNIGYITSNETNESKAVADIPKNVIQKRFLKNEYATYKITETKDTGELTLKIIQSELKIPAQLNTASPSIIVSNPPSASSSLRNTSTLNSHLERHKQDIYDKLDSGSNTNSDVSFEVNDTKSQIINISDLTTSLEDLERLDKICKIIEISDELSDRLFSSLKDENCSVSHKKWSFKELCEKIKLDEFCKTVFGANR